MEPEVKPTGEPIAGNQPEHNDEDRRVAARRRFLRLGAGGSAAFVVTVVHKRAFAGIKKNVIASHCTSLQGVPDLKHAHQKKALETSAMGTPKGLICRPRVDDTTTTGNGSPTHWSRYYRRTGTTNQKVMYVKSGELKHGVGSIQMSQMPPYNTVSASYNYRLYEKGFCPVVFDSSGGITYDTTAKYYESASDTIGKACLKP